MTTYEGGLRAYDESRQNETPVWEPAGGERTQIKGLDLWRPDANHAWFNLGALGGRDLNEMLAEQPAYAGIEAGKILSPSENFGANANGWLSSDAPTGDFSYAWNANEGRMEETNDKLGGDLFSKLTPFNPLKSTERVLKGDNILDVAGDDMAAHEDNQRALTQPVVNTVLDANRQLVGASDQVFGSELTKALAPTGAVLRDYQDNRDAGNSAGDSFASSFDTGIADIHNRTADTMRNAGDFLGEDDGQGTLTGLGGFVDRFSDAESKNVQGTNAGVEKIADGSISQGVHAIGESQDDFWSDPNVQKVAAIVATYGAAAAAAPYIVNALSLTGPGALATATQYANMAINGIKGLASGQDIGKVATDALVGYFAPKVGEMAMPYDASVGPLTEMEGWINKIASGAASGATRSLGGDSEDVLAGTASGGLGAATKIAGNEIGGTTGSVVAGGLNAVGNAAIRGGDLENAALQGVAGSAADNLLGRGAGSVVNAGLNAVRQADQAASQPGGLGQLASSTPNMAGFNAWKSTSSTPNMAGFNAWKARRIT